MSGARPDGLGPAAEVALIGEQGMDLYRMLNP